MAVAATAQNPMRNALWTFGAGLIGLACLSGVPRHRELTRVSPVACSQALSPLRPLPFAPGERLEYTVRFGPLRAGSGSMELACGDSIRGEPTYHATFRVAGGALFFPDGNDHLIQQENLPPGTDFSFPGASFYLGFGVGLAFFP